MSLKWSSRAFATLLGVAFFSCSFAAATESSNLKVYFDLDYFLPGNIGNSLEQAQIEINDDIQSAGGVGSAPSKNLSGAIGGRLGFLSPLPGFDGYWVGGSLGYIGGSKSKVTVNDPTIPPGTITFENKNTYIRALLDIAHISSLSQKISFKFDVGVGLGKGKTKQKRRNLGYYADVYDDSDTSNSSTKLTWEISPAIIIKGESFDLEFGVRYAQFPKIKESDDTFAVNYSAFGFYSGIGF